MRRFWRWLRGLFIVERTDGGMYPDDENGAW